MGISVNQPYRHLAYKHLLYAHDHQSNIPEIVRLHLNMLAYHIPHLRLNILKIPQRRSMTFARILLHYIHIHQTSYVERMRFLLLSLVTILHRIRRRAKYPRNFAHAREYC